MGPEEALPTDNWGAGESENHRCPDRKAPQRAPGPPPSFHKQRAFVGSDESSLHWVSAQTREWGLLKARVRKRVHKKEAEAWNAGLVPRPSRESCGERAGCVWGRGPLQGLFRMQWIDWEGRPEEIGSFPLGAHSSWADPALTGATGSMLGLLGAWEGLDRS